MWRNLDLEPRPPRHAASASRDVRERERLRELASGFAVPGRSELEL
jgi:hypothetical protein